MAICTKIYRKIKRVCIGSLNRKIILYTRAIKAPTQGGVDFSENFANPKKVWSMVETTDGTIFFDDTNIDVSITHNVYIRYRKNITQENWIILPSVNDGDDERLNILKVENFGENNTFLKLICAIRGKDSLLVNEA